MQVVPAGTCVCTKSEYQVVELQQQLVSILAPLYSCKAWPRRRDHTKKQPTEFGIFSANYESQLFVKRRWHPSSWKRA